MTTLLLGLGNPYLKDDRVGLEVVRQAGLLLDDGVVVREASVGGMGLLEALEGFSAAVIVDGEHTGRRAAGTVRSFDLAELPRGAALRSAHDWDLPTALALGRQAGMAVPSRIDVVAVEVEDPFTFDLEMSEATVRAVPGAVETVRRLLAAHRGQQDG